MRSGSHLGPWFCLSSGWGSWWRLPGSLLRRQTPGSFPGGIHAGSSPQPLMQESRHVRPGRGLNSASSSQSLTCPQNPSPGPPISLCSSCTTSSTEPLQVSCSTSPGFALLGLLAPESIPPAFYSALGWYLLVPQPQPRASTFSSAPLFPHQPGQQGHSESKIRKWGVGRERAPTMQASGLKLPLGSPGFGTGEGSPGRPQ